MTGHRTRWFRLRQAGGLGLLVSFAAIPLPACSQGQAGGPREKPSRHVSGPRTPESQSAPALPSPVRILAAAAPDGWSLAGAVELYKPQNLYEKIDGLAELFLSYDVVALMAASFRKSADAEVMLDVYIYDMGTPTNAFGVFSVERSPNEPPVDVGRAAYRSDASVFVWKGRYYLKIIASDVKDELATVELALARKLAGSLADSRENVWGLEAMPRAHLVPGSLRYFRIDAMGLDFMRNTYTAQYRRGNILVDAFLSRQDSPEAAEAAVEQYAKHAKKYGRSVEQLTFAGAKLIRCDMGGTSDVIFRKGRLVAGTSAVRDPDVAVQAASDLWKQLDGPAGAP
jgi:hypothetical protein